MSTPVYLDNAATTPLDSRVLEAMLPHLGGRRGNASSLHASGAAALDAVEEARASVAAFMGAEPGEIFFTSGGTEADNIAVLGLAAASPENQHLVVSRIEHPAVRQAAEHLGRIGYEVSWIGVNEEGRVDPEEFAAALRPDTALAAVMWANNEVGTVQPVEELAVICEQRGVPLHVDAVQAAGRIRIDLGSVPIATLAISGHKLYGPQGVGALYIRRGVEVRPTVFGGGQEQGLRSGTHNVAGITGLGEAARLVADELNERVAHETALRDRILAGVEGITGVRLNGHARERLSNNAHLYVEGVEAEGLVLLCDALGFEIGSGSACASGGHKASPVLLAMGFDEQEAFSVVRVTVGKDTSEQEIDGFVEAFATAVARLRELSPLYAG